MELFDLFAVTADRRAAREREATLERLRPRRERAAAPAKPKPVCLGTTVHPATGRSGR